VLFVGALCAAVAAALGSGARFDPDDMATATVGLLVAAGFTMSRDAGDSTPVVIVAAVVGVVGFVVVLVARVRDASSSCVPRRSLHLPRRASRSRPSIRTCRPAA
jgi:hypothetical protein